jgi:hypothetical protein
VIAPAGSRFFELCDCLLKVKSTSVGGKQEKGGNKVSSPMVASVLMQKGGGIPIFLC